MAPFADLLFFSDARWWGWHRRRPEFQAFAGVKATIENNLGNLPEADKPEFEAAVQEGALQMLRWEVGYVARGPGVIAAGRDSGYQAISIAELAGASAILLLGYDMKNGPAGKAHWFGDHPNKKQTTDAGFTSGLVHYRRFARELARRGVTVINCSPDSALDCFKKESLEQAIARLVPHPAPAALPS